VTDPLQGEPSSKLSAKIRTFSSADYRPLALPGNHLDTTLRIAFLPGIKHGICHRLPPNDHLMPSCIAGQLRDREVAASCRLQKQAVVRLRCQGEPEKLKKDIRYSNVGEQRQRSGEHPNQFKEHERVMLPNDRLVVGKKS
jgi:hypothetical protein